MSTDLYGDTYESLYGAAQAGVTTRYWQPPTDDLNPPLLPKRDPIQPAPKIADLLMRHYKNRAVGRNIYRLKNGDHTEQMPVNPNDIDRIFYGGHLEPVTDEDVAGLMSAGYSGFELGESTHPDTYQDTYESAYGV